MAKRISLFMCVAVLVVAGCKTPTEPVPSESDTGRTEFPTEPETSGLDDRGATSGGAERDAVGTLRTVYFDFDDYALTGSARSDLRHNAGVLESAPDVRIEVQGNCDERGTNEYNLALGKKRAESARQYLIDLGVDSSRVGTISFGEENPEVRGSTEAAWAKNRRDDFIVR